MILLFLHGPPAVGKLTVARELAARTGWRLFHNHLTVDLALSVYDFGTPGFIALREEIWLAVIRRALADRLPGLIFTFNPENSVPQRFIDGLFTEIPARGGRVVSVALTATEAEIERRIGAETRRQHQKLADVAFYRELRDRGTFTSPTIPRVDLSIDTGALAPAAAADAIARYLGSTQNSPEIVRK